MQQYDTFIFDSYDFDPRTGRVELAYRLDDDVQFVERLELPLDGMYAQGVDSGLLNRALFMLHLIGGISYFKTCVPKTIEIESGELTKDQALFWDTVYEHGLGEFCFQNDIDPRGITHFPVEESIPPVPINVTRQNRTLIPIGGGKDSIATIELLRDSKMPCTLLRVGPHPLIETMAEIAGLPLITIKRTISPNLLELNEQGALNGHIPITAYIHALSLVTALLYGFDFVTFSNERSSSEGNVEFKGNTINHQWSKGYEFERLFQYTVKENLTEDVFVFSLLRGMSELTITSIFCNNPQYFEVATSCNKNWKLAGGLEGKRWCKTCPKCAFAYAMCAAFLGKEDLQKIFSEHLFEKEELIPLYKQLLGLEGFKPLECVGTPDEAAVAFLLALERKELKDTPAMKMFLEEKAPQIKNAKELIEQVFEISNDQAIPVEFLSALDGKHH